ncbi:uncharacterized protein GlcG (DUF336 family) [Pedobacter sp. UYP30]|uniref:GlcG/HbpS family heme-binding protein n=1 Tax=Pedobacter sp. UYP30 TaxID=1756400 RepID=UPI00339427FB
MKTLALILTLISSAAFAQVKTESETTQAATKAYVKSVNTLTTKAAFELAKRATEKATSMDKVVSIAVLDASGTTLLLVRGENVGPHNTEASRRKAYTALSTKTPTLMLLRNVQKSKDTENLNTLPELLLMSGGIPIFYKGEVIGSIGISGGGSAENDDLIAKAVAIPELGLTTAK